MRYLEVVNRGKIVNAGHTAVHQSQEEIFVIFAGIPQVLAYQYEIRLEGSDNK